MQNYRAISSKLKDINIKVLYVKFKDLELILNPKENPDTARFVV